MPDSTIRSVIGLTENEVIAANFAALGIANEDTVPLSDAVLSSYSEFIAEFKRIPTCVEISDRIGSCASSVRSACRKLERDGKMLSFRAKSGQRAYMPKVT